MIITGYIAYVNSMFLLYLSNKDTDACLTPSVVKLDIPNTDLNGETGHIHGSSGAGH